MKNSFLNRRLGYSYANYTLRLIIVNILVFILTEYIYPSGYVLSGGQLYYTPGVTYYLAMRPALVMKGYVWQFISYMFVHSGVSHILFNMLGLFIFGSMVERRIGSREFLLFYMLTGIVSGVFSFIAYMAAGTSAVSLVGASGVIYGIMLMFATFFPDARIFVFGIFPVRAPMLVIIYFAIELFSQIRGGGNVAHLTHLAGLGVAYLYSVLRFRIKPFSVWFGRR
ncbi:rhomboid family intramembrane serine protease [Parasphaerochaeta coccoides]|nr:rhomboid family intramembrane serine protease [Parasphaerochaeta coccoides]